MVVSVTGYDTLASPVVGVPPAVTDLNLALTPQVKQKAVFLPLILK